MKELIEKNLELLATLTKEEADFIQQVLSWEKDQQAAFKLAKRIFDSKD